MKDMRPLIVFIASALPSPLFRAIVAPQRRPAGIFEQYGFVLLLVVLAAVAAVTFLGSQISSLIYRVARMLGG